jgi:hypothetical protein
MQGEQDVECLDGRTQAAALHLFVAAHEVQQELLRAT